jgi:anti-sigma B factor antagonist
VQATFTTSTVGDTAVLHCRGELDLAARLGLAGGLADLIVTGASRVVVDLTETSFLDCGSVGVLEAFAGLFTPPRRMIVVCSHGLPRRVLAITDLDQAIPVVPTLVEALRTAPAGRRE